MRDMIGNKLEPGHFIYWKSKDMIVQIAAVNEPRIAIEGRGAQQAPPTLAVQLLIPIMNLKPHEEPVLGDFVRVVDPKSEQALEKVSGILTQ
jgi:hypothetical protein